MLIDLTTEESAFILSLLTDHIAYYKTLAGNPKCSERNLRRKSLVDTIALKLQSEPPRKITI